MNSCIQFLPTLHGKALFTVEDLGGWEALDTEVFGDEGVFTKAFEAVQG